MSGDVLILDVLVYWLTIFELINFDISIPKFESAFKKLVTVGCSNKDKCSKNDSDLYSNGNEID